ncbi:hypothetical protein GQ457_01G027030 [Hibiscus cannabinus]
MHEHRCSDAKNAVATPLMNHMATPSSFPQPPAADDEPWVDDEDRTTLGSSLLDRRLKKPEQLLVVEVVAAMNLVYKLKPWRSRQKK